MATFLVSIPADRLQTEPVASRVDGAIAERRAGLLLLLLTVAGGIFRFATLTRLSLWYDEAQTFRRVSGSFADLMHALHSDGFTPLHYWMEWGIGHLLGGATHLTPFWLRAPGALAGTLMIPAMYWLSRQFCGRKTALLVAAFTSCSAYMNAYSHDAKMYMPLWLFAVLSMTCLLIWTRSGRTWPWIGWVLASIIMVGFHASGIIVLAIQPPAFALEVRPGQRRRAMALWIGLVVILAWPALYYLGVSRWTSNVKEQGWQKASGLAWVPQYNDGRTRGQLLAYVASTYATGWEWPGGSHRSVQGHAADDHELGVAACQGAFIRTPVRLLFQAINLLLLGLAMVGGLCFVRTLLKAGINQTAPAWWRTAILIAVWLVAPVCAFYQVATHPAPLGIAGSSHMIRILVLTSAALMILIGLPALVRTVLGSWKRTTEDPPALLLLMVIFLAAFCLVISAAVRAAQVPMPGWAGIWIPRYMGIVWPAMAIGACTLLLLLPSRALRIGAVVLLLACNCGQSLAAVFVPSRPPVARMVHEMYVTQDPAGDTRTYLPKAPPAPELLGGSIFQGAGKYYLALESGVVPDPSGWLSTPFESVAPLRPSDDPNLVAAEVAAQPRLRRLIVWDLLIPGDAESPDALLRQLGPEWKKAAETHFPVRYTWNWSDVYTLRRCEYLRSHVKQ